MRGAVVLLSLVLASPAMGQDAAGISLGETAAAVAAVEAANLSDSTYRNLWCAGHFAGQQATHIAAAEPAAAQQAATARDALYRKAAVELLAAGMSETAFTAIAEDVYTIVQSQTRAGATARDFTDETCTAALEP